MRASRPIIISVVTGAVLLGAYQNCSNTALEQMPLSEELFFASGTVSLCLNDSLAGYTLESATAHNLNHRPFAGAVYADSDADGVSDERERLLGLDPFKRRTNGKILDGVCLHKSSSLDCEVSPSCSMTPNKLGLTGCDLEVLGLDLVPGVPVTGLDSDGDGMLDLLEVMRGTNPEVQDDSSDPDHDLVINSAEYERGGDPVSYDPPERDLFRSLRIEVTTERIANASCTGGEHWSWNIQKLPWSKRQAIVDELAGTLTSGGIDFTRPDDSSMALLVLKMRPIINGTGNPKILFRRVILSEQTSSLDAKLDDFTLAGDVKQ